MLLQHIWIACIVISLASGSLLAQGRPARGVENGVPAIVAVHAPEPPVLDGLLTDEIWSFAEPASENTQVRILFDSQNLYIGVICYDSSFTGIRATELRRVDQLSNDDVFEIILDTFHDHRNSYLFRINPLGTQYDATVTNEGQTMN